MGAKRRPGRLASPGAIGPACLALGITALCCGLELWLGMVNPHQPSPELVVNVVLNSLVILPPLAFSAVGLLIIMRSAKARMGWVLSSVGLLFALGLVCTDAPPYLSRHHVHGLLLLAPAFVGVYIWTLFVVSVVVLLLLFPTGRPLPGIWSRGLAWGIPVTGLSLVATALTPGQLSPVLPKNPLALSVIPPFVSQALPLATLCMLFLGVAGLVRRFWLSRGQERQQLKWFTYSACVTIVFFLGAFTNSFLATVFTVGYFLAITMIPVAIGIAIMKYRLYDIDVLINRTLVYGSLTVSLAAIYIGGVLGLQALFRLLMSQGGDLAVAISTLAVAALFTPWRSRLQSFIDRRFYRRRYDAVQTLAQLQGKLRDDLELDRLAEEVIALVQDTVQPEHVSFWLP